MAEIEARNVERLVELYRDFEAGKARFLMAFRHPCKLDGLVLARLLGHEVPRVAAQRAVRLRGRPHSYFLYDRGSLIDAGPVLEWMFPRMGGISVHRGKLDRQSLRTSREILANGDYPLLVAPEGAVNGLNDVVSACEPGVAQMGFWCIEDLREKGRLEKTYIVPIGLRYDYLEPPWLALEGVLGELEAHCGLVEPDSTLDRYARLLRLGCHLLKLLDEYYSRFYQLSLEQCEDVPGRLRSLLEVALRVSEVFFNLQPKGSFSDRCRRIEQAGWDRIYREELKGQGLCAVERGLADHIAQEAALRMWHMRLVENFCAVTGTYVKESPTADRFAEMVSIVYQTVLHLEGKTEIGHFALGKQRAVVTVESPICVDERWEQYSSGRQAAREAVADLTRDIQMTLERTARESRPRDHAVVSSVNLVSGNEIAK